MTALPSRGRGAAPASRGGRLFLFGYTLISVLLVWQIVASAMASDLEGASPKDARRFRSKQPEALLAEAQDAFNNGELKAARRYALKALRISPTVGSAYRILGQVAEFSGDQPRADRLYAQAYSLTHRDAPLASILMEKALAAGRYDEALQQAEVVIRRAPPLQGVIVSRVAGFAADPDARPALVRRLGQDPDWRPAFFRELARRGAYDDALFLFTALQKSPAPPTDEELSPVIDRMVWSGRAAEARQAWINNLPAQYRPGSSEIYNPDFKAPAGHLVFDWRLLTNSNATARLPEAGEAPGLHVQMQGLDGAELARQMIVLEPGRYLLTSRAQLADGDGLDLQWRVTCADSDLGPPLTLSVRHAGSVAGQAEVALAQTCNAALHLYALDRDHGDPTSAVVNSVRLRPAEMQP